MTTKHDDILRIEFLPESQARAEGRDLGLRALHWRIALIDARGRELWRGIYSQGIGHHPNWAQKFSMGRLTPDEAERKAECEASCETGRYRRRNMMGKPSVPLPPPLARDVLRSLASDASALDYPSFEDWADEYGYDHDSRKAEAIYRECISVGVALRSLVGDEGVSALAQDEEDAA